MSFKAFLRIEGEQDYELTSCTVLVHRKSDRRGRPASRPMFLVAITIDSVEDTALTEWMIDPNQQKDGEIEIYKADEAARMKVISFKKAFCYQLTEHYYNDISFMKCALLISGEQIFIGDSQFTQ
jgi:Hemolysin coregulated protein Hcp (TssD)